MPRLSVVLGLTESSLGLGFLHSVICALVKLVTPSINRHRLLNRSLEGLLKSGQLGLTILQLIQ